jgi:uncharacterized damage-inducible protein DinB
MDNYIHTLARYNAWANARIATRLSNLTSLILDFNLHSSFPTIRKTVFHVWDAEAIWLSRLQGTSLTSFPSKNFPPDTNPIEFVKTSESFAEFVLNMNNDALNTSCDYKNIAGESFTSLKKEMILHCMNHSTFHRGQVVTMLRTAGVESGIPSTDLITYFRENG